MTHLLASLLTGGRFPSMTAEARNSGPVPESNGSFETILGRETDVSADTSVETTGDGRENSMHEDQVGRESGRKDRAGSERAPATEGREALAPRVTLLGVRMGAGVRVPSLTFMLPESAGPDELAAAVRTQVLRQVANRQLDPGSLDNLRLAISSRELGQVDVDLDASGEKLTVKIVTAGREAENVIRRTSGDLKEALLARTDRFRDVEIKVSDRTTGDKDETGRRQQGRNGPGQEHSGTGERSEELNEDPAGDSVEEG